MLAHPNMGWRLLAQQALVQRNNRDVVPQLLERLANSQPDAAGIDAAAIHTVAVLDGLGAIQGDTAQALRERLPKVAPSAQLALIRVLPRDESLAERLHSSGALQSADARVRLACYLALAELPASPKAGQYLAQAIRTAADLTADAATKDGLLIAAGVHGEAVLDALTESMTPLAPAAIAATEFLATNVARAGWKPLWNRLLVRLAQSPESPTTGAILQGALNGWRADSAELDAAAQTALRTLLAQSRGASQVPTLQLAQAWGMTGLEAEVRRVAKGCLARAADATLPTSQRAEAVRQTIAIAPRDAELVRQVLALISPNTDPTLAVATIDAVGQSKAAETAQAVVARLPELSPQPRQAALRWILSRPDATTAFLQAVQAGKARFDQLALDQKTALTSHPDATIAALAQSIMKSGGGLPDANRQKVIDALAPQVLQGGSVSAGKVAFTQHCAKCHRHGTEGQMIGPDLTGMATHPREELLIHILDPSRSVEANFRTFVAKTLDGRVITGLLAGETKAAVELLDAENKRYPVARDDLEELRESPKSLMPEGFEAQMPVDQLRDLLAFLTNKGKYTPLPIGPVATVSSGQGLFYDTASRAKEPADATQPAGEYPPEDASASVDECEWADPRPPFAQRCRRLGGPGPAGWQGLLDGPIPLCRWDE